MLPAMTFLHSLTNPGHAKEFECYQTTPASSIFDPLVAISAQSSLNMLLDMTFIHSLTNPCHAKEFENYQTTPSSSIFDQPVALLTQS